MSEFEVKPSSLKGISSEIRGVSSRVNIYALELELLKKYISASMSSYSSVEKTLKKSIRYIEDDVEKLRHMSSTLKDIATHYENTEKSIMGQKVTKTPVRNQANDGIDTGNLLHDFFKKLSDRYDDFKKQLNNNPLEEIGLWICGIITTGKIGEFIHSVTGNNDLEEILFNIVADPVSKTLAFTYVPDDDNIKDPDHDFYRTNEAYGVQRNTGFMDAYDDAGGILGMDLDTSIVEFATADGRHYRFQLWKGSYGYGNAYGGEIGFYTSDKDGGWYECARGKDEISTEQFMYDKKGNLLLHNNTEDYAQDGDHFWNLMIRTDSGYGKDDLTQVSVVEFPDKMVEKAFLNEVRSNPQKYRDIVVTERPDGKVSITYQ